MSGFSPFVVKFQTKPVNYSKQPLNQRLNIKWAADKRYRTLEQEENMFQKQNGTELEKLVGEVFKRPSATFKESQTCTGCSLHVTTISQDSTCVWVMR